MTPDITSHSNPRIKQIRSLYQHRSRQKSGLFVVEGIRHVGDAVDSGVNIEAIYFDPERLNSKYALGLIETERDRGVSCFSVSKDVFDSVTEKENPQGILAVVRQPDHQLVKLTPDIFPWGVALVSPQDSGNVGSILRTIDAVGASGLILIDCSLDIYQPGVVRASMGTIFWYPILKVSFDEFRVWSIAHAYHLYGSSARSDCDYRDADGYQSPRILLLGSEREGLSEEQQMLCERVVSLPMVGKASSLNLSVAAGVLLYSMLERS